MFKREGELFLFDIFIAIEKIKDIVKKLKQLNEAK